MKIQRSIFLASLAAIALAVPAKASADATAKPKNKTALAHYRQGTQHFRLAEYTEAVTAYKAGYRIEPAPVFLHNIALCYRRTGQYKLAISFYESFLSANPPPAVAQSVRRLIESMRAELEQKARSEKPDQPLPSKQPAVSDFKQAPRARPWYSDRLGWGFSGGAIAFGVTGIALNVSASSLRETAKSEPDTAARDRLEDQAATRQTWGTITAITGGVFVAAALVRFVWWRPKRASSKATKRVSLAVTSSWIGINGTF